MYGGPIHHAKTLMRLGIKPRYFYGLKQRPPQHGHRLHRTPCDIENGRVNFGNTSRLKRDDYNLRTLYEKLRLTNGA